MSNASAPPPGGYSIEIYAWHDNTGSDRYATTCTNPACGFCISPYSRGAAENAASAHRCTARQSTRSTRSSSEHRLPSYYRA